MLEQFDFVFVVVLLPRKLAGDPAGQHQHLMSNDDRRVPRKQAAGSTHFFSSNAFCRRLHARTRHTRDQRDQRDQASAQRRSQGDKKRIAHCAVFVAQGIDVVHACNTSQDQVRACMHASKSIINSSSKNTPLRSSVKRSMRNDLPLSSARQMRADESETSRGTQAADFTV